MTKKYIAEIVGNEIFAHINEEDFSASDDFSWVLIATSENSDWYVSDASQGFYDRDVFINGRSSDDSPISCSVVLEPNSMYKLENFHYWQTTNSEYGFVDDFGWESSKAILLYRYIKDKEGK